jgi:hypothetical protein
MPRLALPAFLVAAAIGLAACGIEPQPSDPNLLLPPGDRPARGPGLFSGEDGVFTIPIE